MAGNTTILSAIQTIIQAMNRYSSANVTIGDTRKLSSGTGPWAILWPGAPSLDRESWGQIDYEWTDYLEIWRRFDGDSLTNIIADLDDVVVTLATYPTINATANISDLAITRIGRPQYLRPAGANAAMKPSHVGYEITMVIHEYRNHSGSGEFA